MLQIDQSIVINDAPEIPGLNFRRFRYAADYPVIAALINGCKTHDGIERAISAENVAHTYSHLVNCDPDQDILFAEVDGRPVGYNRGWWQPEPGGDWVGMTFGQVLPEWRRRGIGRALLRYVESRLAQTLAAQRAAGQVAPGMPGYFSTEVSDTEKDRRALLEAMGYQAVRFGRLMVRPGFADIPAAPLPEGLEVRPVRPEQYRLVWDAMIEAFRDHWGFIEPQETHYDEWMTGPEFQPDLWQVAWAGDEVAGMVLNFVLHDENAEYNRKRGYTENICVRRPWRRQGVARALLVRSLCMFRDMGYAEASLGVDTQNENQAFNLYEGVGFRTVRTDTVYRKPMISTEE